VNRMVRQSPTLNDNQKQCIIDLLDIPLKDNNFSFNNKLYNMQGLPMGK